MIALKKKTRHKALIEAEAAQNGPIITLFKPGAITMTKELARRRDEEALLSKYNIKKEKTSVIL